MLKVKTSNTHASKKKNQILNPKICMISYEITESEVIDALHLISILIE